MFDASLLEPMGSIMGIVREGSKIPLLPIRFLAGPQDHPEGLAHICQTAQLKSPVFLARLHWKARFH